MSPTEKEIINNTRDYVKRSLLNAEAGHDWFHIERVYKNSLLIASIEPCNLFVVSLAALLHDIADSKFHKGDETVGPKIANEFLTTQQVDSETLNQVVKIIENISFKGGHTVKKHHSIELDIVQDADRLDAMGAIGISRAFHYGGYKNRLLYDPAIKPNVSMSKEQYKKSTTPTINHFYEKLLLLKGLMNTETGKKLATKRHDFMLDFLNQFFAEWSGEV
ncbi:HD domain-containing protein [Planktosalinus lacus]|uniref:Phosphohydrolase n=1 Tax=Planktosalinus lacus TaxID=1526573 RepID=A0A8J2VA15_9FLAO|nr:HD domain-containing protein [Planktosalinus lacus]GGD94846.1 phosphohydrolase [Planktosalinus lacus]